MFNLIKKMPNYDEPEYQKAINTEKLCQLMLSDNELIIIHGLICKELIMKNITDKNKEKIYIGIAKKISDKLTERWSDGQNIRK